jgi:PKD repeat protein
VGVIARSATRGQGRPQVGRARFAVLAVLAVVVAACSLAIAPGARADPLDLLPPVASIDATPNPATTGQLVALDGSGSSDIDGTITRYEWDLDGDGSFETDTGTESFVSTQFFSPGTFTVGLRVSDTGEPSPNTDEAEVTMTVLAVPSASFDFSPAGPLTGESVTFTSTSSDPDGSIASQAWDLDNDGGFDDGTASSVSRSFATAGTKTVRLRVTDNDGLTNDASKTVTVGNRAPAASFDFSPASPMTGETVTFTSTSSDPDGSIASQAWDLDNDGGFDDGTASSVSHSFPTSGTKTVRLEVTDDDGATDVATMTVTVGNRAPSASFDSSPASPLTGESVTFTSTSSDPDGSIASQAWDLDNDGEFDDGTAASVSHSFPTSGTKTVRLRVTDDDGLTDDASETITIGNRAPAASFDFTPATPLSGENVTFTSTSSDPDGSIASQAWDLDNDGEFDDGTAASVSHSFPTSGTKTVRLRVTDNEGLTDDATKTVTVGNRAPSPSFGYSPPFPVTGQAITFTSTSSDPDGSIASQAWDLDNDGSFDDGTASSASHSFPTSGSKTVRLMVTDNDGTSAVATSSVSVGGRPPVASFTVSNSSPLSGETVTLTATSTDPDSPIAGHAWDLDNDGAFDDGSGSIATVSFPTPGTRTVRLEATDADGLTGVATTTLTVGNRAPTASFNFAPGTPLSGENVTFTSTSSDPDGSIASQAWDLDNDGSFDDGTAASVSQSFPTPGSKTVRLSVTDDRGVTGVTTTAVMVGNRAPAASFDFSPAGPLSGDTITLTSTSSDPDGSIASQVWDLDNDGEFDDGTGATRTTSFAAPGTHRLNLRVTDNNGVTATATKDIFVINRAPAPSFDFSPATPLSGENVTFTSTSGDPDGSIASQAWDLDNDGEFDDASGSGATTSFLTPGTKTVRLQVTDDQGASTVATRSIPVANRPPQASIAISPESPLSGQTVTLTSTSSDPDGSIASQAWDLDNDGEFDDASGSGATTSFLTPGTKTVGLRVIDDQGTSTVATRSIPVGNRAPLASFSVSPESPLSGQTTTFTATASDPDGSIAAYAWDLDNDGSFNDSTSSIATRSFATPGPNTVRLRVTDNSGTAVIAQTVVNVANRPPTASFTYSPLVFQTGDEVDFTATASDPDGSITAYAWDLDNDGSFDDASGSSVQNYRFTTPGSHVVALLVTDNNGATYSVQQTVATGNRAPSPAFSFSPSSPLTGVPVTFTSTSSDPDGSIVTHEWDLDNDGTFETTGASVSRSFSLPGTYTVKLRVTDNSGAAAELPRDVVIGNRAPTVTTISTDPPLPTTLQDVTFSSDVADPEGLTPLTINWDLDNDGAYDDASGPNASRSFRTGGSYTIRVRVVDSLGALATLTKSVAIANRAPTASFIQSPARPSPFETVRFTSTSGDLDGLVATQEWDTDNDGNFDDGTADNATRKFTESGAFTVRLRVTDNAGAVSTAAQTVVVGNRPPVASFGYSPVQPIAGEPVTFYSTSSDPDTPIAGYAWDLNGDGRFGDGAGTTATAAYPVGSHSVTLMVTDSEGASAFATQTITVSAAPVASATTAPTSRAASPRLMSPFPVVRVTGSIRRRGSKLRVLSVTAPVGATVLVRCGGRSCPVGRQSQVVTSGKGSKGDETARIVRIRRLEGKLLRSGTRINIFVTKPGTIGKYTSFRIRSGRPPARADKCLAPGSAKPVACTAS